MQQRDEKEGQRTDDDDPKELLLVYEHLKKKTRWFSNYGFYLMAKKKNPRITYTNSAGNSLMVQWLGLCILQAKGLGSTPGQGIKGLEATAVQPREKKNSIKRNNKLNYVSLSK